MAGRDSIKLEKGLQKEHVVHEFLQERSKSNRTTLAKKVENIAEIRNHRKMKRKEKRRKHQVIKA